MPTDIRALFTDSNTELTCPLLSADSTNSYGWKLFKRTLKVFESVINTDLRAMAGLVKRTTSSACRRTCWRDQVNQVIAPVGRFWKTVAGRRRRRSPRPCPVRPSLLCLEQRCLLTTFLVTSTNDSGPGSLRQAILYADASPGTADQIQFDIAPGGHQTITLLSALPAITDQVVLDGTTQPGYGGKPLIELAGVAAGAGASGIDLESGSAGSTIKGLIINGFTNDGIVINSANDTIEANWIGLNATGTASVANGGFGIEVEAGATGTTIGGTTSGDGNVISGNTLGGIQVTGYTPLLLSETNNVLLVDSQTGAVLATYATGVPADGAVIGPDGSIYVDDYLNHQILHFAATGAALPSFGVGYLSSSQDLIFGPDGNLYVGDADSSVQEFSPTGAFIRTFVTPGSGGLSNAKGLAFGPDGDLYVASFFTSSVLRYDGTSGAFLGTFVASGSDGLSGPEGITFGPDGNLYVSSYSNASVLEYNGQTGASLGVFATSGLINHPWGLAFDGAGNLDVVSEQNSSIETFGGTSGNTLAPLLQTNHPTPEFLSTVPGNVIEGNHIGTDITGSIALPNQVGILVAGSNTLIGGTIPGTGNTIADNSGKGVVISSGSGNAILGNSIHGNLGLGIDLGNNGVTSNAATMNLTLANAGMDYPVLSSTTLVGNVLTVTGYVGSLPGQAPFGDARVEIFQSDNDPSDYGQGQTYLGYLTTDASGLFSGSFSVSGLNPGDSLTATATSAENNTSEFSANVLVVGMTSTKLSSTSASTSYGQSESFTATVSGGGGATGLITFQDAGVTIGTAPLVGGRATFTTSALQVGMHQISAEYSGAANFTPSTSLVLVQTVTPAALTITADNQRMVYGSPLPTLTVSYQGFVNGDTPGSLSTAPTLVTSASATSPVGNYGIVASGASDPDYTIHYVAGILTVTPAILHITADNEGRPFGQANPELTATYVGFVNGDTAASLDGRLSFSLSATSRQPPGYYPITPAGLLSSDYTIVYRSGTLTIYAAASKAMPASPPISVFSEGNTSGLRMGTAGPALGLPSIDSLMSSTLESIPVSALPITAPLALSTPESVPVSADLAFLPRSRAVPVAVTDTVMRLIGGSEPVEFLALPPQAAPGQEKAGREQPQNVPAVPIMQDPMPERQPLAAERPPIPQALDNGPRNLIPDMPLLRGAPDTLAADLAEQSNLVQEQFHEIKENAKGWSRPISATLSGIAAFTAGYVLLTSRTTSWLLSLLIARPLFKQFDPLEILFAWEQEQKQRRSRNGTEADNETLQEMVK